MDREITALIADDEAHMRTFMKLLLMDLGIKKVYLMQNGMDAIDAYKEYEPDLVLLDINMNVMNGLDALKQIKKINPDTKVVMMTAVSTRDSVDQCSRTGASFYILKTQTPDEIRARLKDAIDSIGIIAKKPQIMDTSNPPKSERRITSLDEHIIKYDYTQMRREAQSEFDASLSTRELIDQESIAKIFQLNKDDERN